MVDVPAGVPAYGFLCACTCALVRCCMHALLTVGCPAMTCRAHGRSSLCTAVPWTHIMRLSLQPRQATCTCGALRVQSTCSSVQQAVCQHVCNVCCYSNGVVHKLPQEFPCKPV